MEVSRGGRAQRSLKRALAPEETDMSKKTFVTVNAVDGFNAGTEWTYQQVQKQFGPKRFAEMKASGEMLSFTDDELEKFRSRGAAAAQAMIASLPSGAAAAADGAPQADREERKRVAKLQARLHRAEKAKAARAGRLTDLQKAVLAKMDVSYHYSQEYRLCKDWAEYSDDIASHAKLVRELVPEGSTVFAASGALSSLVEKGVLFTDRINPNNKGTGGYVIHYVTKEWFDRVVALRGEAL